MGEHYEQRIGAHVLRFEPPDVYIAAGVGDISEVEMAQAIEAIERFANGTPHSLFAISDLSRFGATSGGARRALMRLFPLLRGAVLIGTSASFRITLSLVRKAASLFFRMVNEVPVVFVDSEDEARAWIEAQRHRDGVGPLSQDPC